MRVRHNLSAVQLVAGWVRISRSLLFSLIPSPPPLLRKMMIWSVIKITINKKQSHFFCFHFFFEIFLTLELTSSQHVAQCLVLVLLERGQLCWSM